MSKSKEEAWEDAFDTLDKRVFSVDAIGGYGFEKTLQEFASNDSQILDYGCGKGQLVEKLREDGFTNVVGTDPSQNLISQAGLSDDILKVMTNNKIPYPDNYFDFSYCSGVLHHIHWDHLPTVLAELSRVLKPEGVFVFVEPRNSIWRKLGHLVVLSPLSRLYKNAFALAECLRAEWPTYKPWLLKEKKEFIPMCKTAGFKYLKTKNKMFTTTGVIRNGKKA